MHLLLLLFLLTASLQAKGLPSAVALDDGSALVAEHVNVVTGDLIIQQLGLQVRGAIPLPIPRSYHNRLYDKSEAGWKDYLHCKLFREAGKKKESLKRFFVTDASGLQIEFQLIHDRQAKKILDRCDRDKHAKGILNYEPVLPEGYSRDGGRLGPPDSPYRMRLLYQTRRKACSFRSGM